jgi:hypothetical protein
MRSWPTSDIASNRDFDNSRCSGRSLFTPRLLAFACREIFAPRSGNACPGSPPNHKYRSIFRVSASKSSQITHPPGFASNLVLTLTLRTFDPMKLDLS